jgi:hypothetical protein
MLLWPLHAHTGAEIKGRFPNADSGERDAQNNTKRGCDNLYFGGKIEAMKLCEKM